MTFVELVERRHRGWPQPEDSWGLTPMHGSEGWCRACGTPRVAQSGPLILKRAGLSTITAAWLPNWQYDALCIEGSFAAELAESYSLKLLPVRWANGGGDPAVSQVVIESTKAPWFDPPDLELATKQVHKKSGTRCGDCGTWRWMPVTPELRPPLVAPPDLDGLDIAASPEWFGDGWKSYREILVRAELAELIAERSPKDFQVGPPARFRYPDGSTAPRATTS